MGPPGLTRLSRGTSAWPGIEKCRSLKPVPKRASVRPNPHGEWYVTYRLLWVATLCNISKNSNMHMYIYTYIYMCVDMYMYVYIYIYWLRERERERERESNRKKKTCNLARFKSDCVFLSFEGCYDQLVCFTWPFCALYSTCRAAYPDDKLVSTESISRQK